MTTQPSVGTRTLGRDGLVVSSIGLGCMGMSQAYGDADRPESIATIHRALDLGVTFLDTSDVYGSGHNEELVGEAIADRRDEVLELEEALRADVTARQLLWIDIEGNLDEADGERFAKRFALEWRTRRALQRSLAEPFIGVHGEYVHVRVAAEPDPVRSTTAWLDIIAGENVVITSHQRPIEFLVDFDEPEWGLLRNFDVVGLFSMAVFLGSLEYVLEEGQKEGWFSDQTIVLLSLAATVAGVTFFARVLTARAPIVDLRAFLDRNFAVGSLLTFVLGIGLVGVVGAAALGFTAAAAGLTWSYRRPREPEALPPAG